jgi:hypothetical protein
MTIAPGNVAAAVAAAAVESTYPLLAATFAALGTLLESINSPVIEEPDRNGK